MHHWKGAKPGTLSSKATVQVFFHPKGWFVCVHALNNIQTA